MIYRSALLSWNLENARVFLRADLNVPLSNGIIQDDFKLQELIPTLDAILHKKGKIILATHIGRPEYPQSELSTRHLLPWFTHHGYSIEFCENLQDALASSKKDSKTIILLENVRFYPGEKNQDFTYIEHLKKLSDYYVNDAFGTLHRTDASVLSLPELFIPTQRTFGLLIQKELEQAQKIKNPLRPFCVILGGGKIADKIPFIKALLPKVDHLLLCPGIDGEFKQFAAEFKSASIESPQDYLVGKSLTQGPFTLKQANELGPHDFPISIGPETQKKYAGIIARSTTSFYNGLMGSLENPQTLIGVYGIFTAMQTCDYALVGGGDSTAAARKLGFANKLNLSTGGGALLAYISGQKLPALDILINRAES